MNADGGLERRRPRDRMGAARRNHARRPLSILFIGVHRCSSVAVGRVDWPGPAGGSWMGASAFAAPAPTFLRNVGLRRARSSPRALPPRPAEARRRARCGETCHGRWVRCHGSPLVRLAESLAIGALTFDGAFSPFLCNVRRRGKVAQCDGARRSPAPPIPVHFACISRLNTLPTGGTGHNAGAALSA